MDIEDWTAKAAKTIHEAFIAEGGSSAAKFVIEDRIATIIATFADPLITLLRESRREHRHCDDSWYCCKKCSAIDHGGLEDVPADAMCNCGADAWNARVDAALAGHALA